MLPILFSVGSIPISSFGLFLALSFLAAVFISWRIAKAYDLNEGKILDLAIFTFFGGLIFARVYFIILNLSYFSNISRIFLINLYPGLGFWGGFVGGILTLKFLTMRAKLNFWQIIDIAAVGLMVGLMVGNIGCFLGGCGYGPTSNSSLAVSVVGLVGKRIPFSLFESFIFLLFFWWLWKSAIRFHFNGKIFAFALTFIGLEKFFIVFFKDSNYFEQLIAVVVFSVGVAIYYWRSKKSFTADITFILQVITTPKQRNLLLQRLSKSCYNAKIGWKIKLNKIRKKLNVKSNPRNYQ